ncbi:endonuclease/exonuclease/phosphatase family protein [Streptomyces sp. NPDC057236]|uniref:endonuclease/exonuclease/phosphatase family protein n=1 Tax=Streptomyces sp. NPDC057236 TaxID=3346059 RepID=UPI00363B5CBE
MSGIAPASVLTPETSVAAPAAAAAENPPSTGPGASGPDLSHENRMNPPGGLPDWSRVGYRGGLDLPSGDSGATTQASCVISAGELASTYKVIADDGVDDTTGLQRAIDYVKSDCSPQANPGRLSRIELPAGRLDVSRQIYVDASFLTVRGKGSGENGTRLVFRPDVNTRYDTLVNGRWDQDAMSAGSGSDVGKGGWIWPGRGLFRVQTRDMAERYKDDWAAAPANRKDLFEGSINQHWASGLKLGAQSDDPGYAARQGHSVVQLDAKANMDKFVQNGYVWVGAANSMKFYEQQGITDTSLMESLHMRQQMFRLVGKDTVAKTITLDRPLEWDLPVDSVSDGSAPLGSTPYASKVTPLTVVEGVGFEDFSFTQDMNGLPKLGGGTYALTPEQAKHNYGNLAPEYAMHGIVFKWAANSWARGLKAEMTGSHPIVTEVARNLQIERNSFDGAWNKGKGGNGYLRGSRVWNSLWALNTSRNLRHFTFQWSASGNVAFRNDLDSDLNLHGGWEHGNLFEQNTVRIPYEHRSAGCSANCGGEGGQIDEGTWYPIWWAAGPKAAKWAGSSGPRNVFYNNTLIKQATEGGPFEPYTPYGTSSGTAFQFGSNTNDANQFRHLSQDGQVIADWTGRETQDFLGKGVAALDVGNRHSLFLDNTGGELEPRPNEARRTVGTWNIRGATSRVVGVNYDVYERIGRLMELDLLNLSLVALQEAGRPPRYDPGGYNPHVRRIPQNQYVRWNAAGTQRVSEDVLEVPLGTPARRRGYVYWLHTHNDISTTGRNNIGIVTYSRLPLDDGRTHIWVAAGPVDSNGVSTGRPALGVRLGDTVYWTLHGDSQTNGSDVPQILRNINRQMSAAGPNGAAMRYVVMGDFNRTPSNLEGSVFASDFTVHRSAAPTYHRPNRDYHYDYAVTAGRDMPNAVTVEAREVHAASLSDHYLSTFYVNAARVEDEPGQTPPDDGHDSPPPRPTKKRIVLRGAKTGKSALPSGQSGDGSQVVAVPVDPNHLPLQNFEVEADPEYPGYHRVRHVYSGAYLGQVDTADSEVYTKTHWYGTESLWFLVEGDDHTWMLVNHHTGQALTSVVVSGQERLFGRDWDVEDSSQRWFLQDADQALNAYEITDPTESPGQVLRPLNGSPEEGAPLEMVLDSNDPSKNFTVIEADARNGEKCFYAVNQDGRYLNSTSGSVDSPSEGNTLTLNAYHPDSDGYLLCSRTDPRTEATVLSQHRLFNEFVFLTTRGISAYVGLTYSIRNANLFRFMSKNRR